MPFWDVMLLGNSDVITNLGFPHINLNQNVAKNDNIMTHLLRHMLDWVGIGLLKKKDQSVRSLNAHA